MGFLAFPLDNALVDVGSHNMGPPRNVLPHFNL
jgi:hypothetical protein